MSQEQFKWKILIMDRGFVWVGRVRAHNSDPLLLEIEDNLGWIVRRWGTSEGIGQLGMQGPQESTTLDKEETESISKLPIFRTILCNQKIWNDWAKTNNHI